MENYSLQFLRVLIFLLLGKFDQSSSFPVRTPEDCIAFLERYGYMRKNSRMPAEAAFLMYQRMARIPMTGVPDGETVKKMNLRRCGNADVAPDIVIGRQKRYALAGRNTRWRNRNVSYRVSRYSESPKLPKDRVDEQIQRAFQLWEGASNIRFVRSTGSEADIDIKFVKGDHEDLVSFDGPGEVLAHAFPPGSGLGGDVHFDDEEIWDLTGSSGGANFPWVSVHEIGHALGLAHSSVDGSIMLPEEGDFTTNLKLHPDDIEGLQSLYGRVASDSPIENEATILDFLEARSSDVALSSPIRRPNLCAVPNIDAVVTLNNGQTFVFSGYYAVRLKEDGKGLTNDIQRISHLFPNVTAHHIDAALTTEDGNTYLIKGKKVWKLHNFGLAEDQTVPKIFRDLQVDLDATFRWGTAIYLIQRNNVLVVDERSTTLRNSGKLHDLNIPDTTVSAAFNSPSGEVVVFNGDRFWTLTERSDGSLMAETAKPKNTRRNFLHCGSIPTYPNFGPNRL